MLLVLHFPGKISPDTNSFIIVLYNWDKRDNGEILYFPPIAPSPFLVKYLLDLVLIVEMLLISEHHKHKITKLVAVLIEGEYLLFGCFVAKLLILDFFNRIIPNSFPDYLTKNTFGDVVNSENSKLLLTSLSLSWVNLLS